MTEDETTGFPLAKRYNLAMKKALYIQIWGKT